SPQKIFPEGGAVLTRPQGRTAPLPEEIQIGSRRRRPEAGGSGVGAAKPGQGGEGVLARTLTRFCGANRRGWRATAGGASPPGGVKRAKRAQRGVTGWNKASDDFGARRRWRAGEATPSQGGERKRTLTRSRFANRWRAGGRRRRSESNTGSLASDASQARG